MCLVACSVMEFFLAASCMGMIHDVLLPCFVAVDACANHKRLPAEQRLNPATAHWVA
jgi:hypothetical protein